MFNKNLIMINFNNSNYLIIVIYKTIFIKLRKLKKLKY